MIAPVFAVSIDEPLLLSSCNATVTVMDLPACLRQLQVFVNFDQLIWTCDDEGQTLKKKKKPGARSKSQPD